MPVVCYLYILKDVKHTKYKSHRNALVAFHEDVVREIKGHHYGYNTKNQVIYQVPLTIRVMAYNMHCSWFSHTY